MPPRLQEGVTMAKNILVVGATGYIGRHVAAAMNRMGHKVVAYVRSDGSAVITGCNPTINAC